MQIHVRGVTVFGNVQIKLYSEKIVFAFIVTETGFQHGVECYPTVLNIFLG